MATKATKKKRVSVKRIAKTEFQPKSFQVYETPPPFFTFKITRQTIYWIILMAVISALTLWILKLQNDVTDILNTISIQR